MAEEPVPTKMAEMSSPATLERFTFRAALVLGFGVTLGLWLYTGVTFDQRIATVRREADEISSRYTRAQELLSTVRAQVLLSAVTVRDALLDSSPSSTEQVRQQLIASSHVSTMALADYEPVTGSTDENQRIDALRREIDQFQMTSLEVLADVSGKSPAAIRRLLNQRIGPRREAALAISEEITTLNRNAFVKLQMDEAELYQTAELSSRRQLGGALVIGLGVLLLTSLYAWKLESRLRKQMTRDAAISAELQQTSAKVLNAQEEERRTIARELHDEVGQALTAIRVELDVAQRRLSAAGAAPETLHEAQTITDGALHTVRNLTKLLHPAALDDLGLPAVIEASLRGLARRHNIRAHLHQVGLNERLPREVELAAYRIIQEALTNVARHAHATECNVRLTQLSDRLLVEVEDNGVGFVDDSDRPIIARGLGLVSVRERAARLGGTFNVLSSPGEGTRVIVSLPEHGVALA
jgi:signal transduction histidine kinase